MSDDGWEDDGWKDEETSNTTAQVGPGGDGLSPQEGGGGGDGYRREGHFVRECPHGMEEVEITSAGTDVRLVLVKFT